MSPLHTYVAGGGTKDLPGLKRSGVLKVSVGSGRPLALSRPKPLNTVLHGGMGELANLVCPLPFMKRGSPVAAVVTFQIKINVIKTII